MFASVVKELNQKHSSGCELVTKYLKTGCCTSNISEFIYLGHSEFDEPLFDCIKVLRKMYKMNNCTTYFIVYRALDVCTVTAGNSLSVASSWSADKFRITPLPDIVATDATLCLLSARRRQAVQVENTS
jgi:hypothetical protein